MEMTDYDGEAATRVKPLQEGFGKEGTARLSHDSLRNLLSLASGMLGMVADNLPTARSNLAIAVWLPKIRQCMSTPRKTTGQSALCPAEAMGARWRHFLAVVAAASMLTGYASSANAEYYFRGGLGFDGPTDTEFKDHDCHRSPPAPLYGCPGSSNTLDGVPYRRSLGDFGTFSSLELGYGYVFSPATRLEVGIEYRPKFSFSGFATWNYSYQQPVSAELSSLSAMVSGYVDLPALGFPKFGRFEPFVGVGVGIARTRIGATRIRFRNTTTILPGATRSSLTWMVTAGVATPIKDRLTLDLAWRYTGIGTIHTGVGGGRVVWRDGSKDPIPLNQAATVAKPKIHGFRISLRYMY